MKTYLARFSGLVVAGMVGFVAPAKSQGVSPGDLLVLAESANSVHHFRGRTGAYPTGRSDSN